MHIYDRFSFKTLILLHELALLLLLFIITTLAGGWAYFWQHNSAESVRIHSLLYLTEQIHSALYGQIQQIIQARVLDDVKAPESYLQYSSDIGELFNQLRGHAVNREEDRLIQALQVAYSTMQNDMNRIFISEQPTRVKILILDPGFAQRNTEKFNNNYKQLKHFLLDRHTQLLANFSRWTDWIVLCILAAFILALLLVFYTRGAFRDGFVKPMSHIMQKAQYISKGDLHCTISEQGVAEVADLARTINKMTEDLAASHDALIANEKQAALGALVPVVAHNIRNPLASIRASAQLLEADDNPADLEEGKQAIIMTIDRLERWVTALVSYLHPLRPNYRLTYASDMMEASLFMLEPKLAEKNIRVEKSCWDDQRLNVDPNLMEQAIYAMMVNAVEASPTNSVLNIALKRVHTELEFHIQDEGQGISFTPNPEALSPGPSTKRMGTGLGIPIAVKICQKHGWQLSIDKMSAGGTLVIIKAPIRVDEELL